MAKQKKQKRAKQGKFVSVVLYPDNPRHMQLLNFWLLEQSKYCDVRVFYGVHDAEPGDINKEHYHVGFSSPYSMTVKTFIDSVGTCEFSEQFTLTGLSDYLLKNMPFNAAQCDFLQACENNGVFTNGVVLSELKDVLTANKPATLSDMDFSEVFDFLKTCPRTKIEFEDPADAPEDEVDSDDINECVWEYTYANLKKHIALRADSDRVMYTFADGQSREICKAMYAHLSDRVHIINYAKIIDQPKQYAQYVLHKTYKAMYVDNKPTYDESILAGDPDLINELYHCFSEISQAAILRQLRVESHNYLSCCEDNVHFASEDGFFEYLAERSLFDCMFYVARHAFFVQKFILGNKMYTLNKKIATMRKADRNNPIESVKLFAESEPKEPNDIRTNAIGMELLARDAQRKADHLSKLSDDLYASYTIARDKMKQQQQQQQE